MDLIIILLILLLTISMIILISWVNSSNSSNIIGSSENTIEWENKNVYSSSDIIDIVEYIEKHIPKFNPITNGELTQFKKSCSKNKNISLDQLISIRNMIATQKSINARENIYKKEREIKESYNTDNKDLAKFFGKFSIPPLAIVKILDPKNLPSKIIEYASTHDSENPTVHKKILMNADKFELNLVNWIKNTYPTIKFKTQNELVQEQIIKYGQPISTPDILFEQPVLIRVTNNTKLTEHLIRWIDAKNYTLINIPFIMKSINKQCDKYLTNYGPGALAFHYGFSDDIKIPKILILDASFIK